MVTTSSNFHRVQTSKNCNSLTITIPVPDNAKDARRLAMFQRRDSELASQDGGGEWCQVPFEAHANAAKFTGDSNGTLVKPNEIYS